MNNDNMANDWFPILSPFPIQANATFPHGEETLPNTVDGKVSNRKETDKADDIQSVSDVMVNISIGFIFV